jgi:hypothetical protein
MTKSQPNEKKPTHIQILKFFIFSLSHRVILIMLINSMHPVAEFKKQEKLVDFFLS